MKPEVEALRDALLAFTLRRKEGHEARLVALALEKAKRDPYRDRLRARVAEAKLAVEAQTVAERLARLAGDDLALFFARLERITAEEERTNPEGLEALARFITEDDAE